MKNLQILTPAILMFIWAQTPLSAGVSVVSGEPFKSYITKIAKESGKAEREVQEDAIEHLRNEAGVSREDLERIGRDKVDLSPAKQNELISLLHQSDTFRLQVGLAVLRNSVIAGDASAAFEALKNVDSGSTRLQVPVGESVGQAQGLIEFLKARLGLIKELNVQRIAFRRVRFRTVGSSPGDAFIDIELDGSSEALAEAAEVLAGHNAERLPTARTDLKTTVSTQLLARLMRGITASPLNQAVGSADKSMKARGYTRSALFAEEIDAKHLQVTATYAKDNASQAKVVIQVRRLLDASGKWTGGIVIENSVTRFL